MNNGTTLYLRAIRGPVLLITIGILFAIHQAGVFPIQRTWPLILIVAGLVILAERLSAAPQGTPSNPQPQSPPYPNPQAGYYRPGRAGRFLARRSVAGPLVVIFIGILFLLQTLSPGFSIGRIAANYWPYVLIAWGAVQVIEVSVYAARGRLAQNYLTSGGGAWVLVGLICLFGSGMFAFQRPDHWWYHGYRSRIAVFGPEHDYAVPPIQKPVGSAPHITIEGFRGDAKISGTSGTMLLVSGHKAIHAMDSSNADRANRTTPVEVIVRGDEVTVRCNEYGDQNKIPVTTDLQLTVPSAASIQFDGSGGDVNVSSIAGDVRLAGRGGDIELQKVGGKVTIDGHYEGMIALRDISQPIHVDNMGTHLDLQRVPGEVKIDRGMLSAQNVVGPVKLNTNATDVNLQNFSEGLELSVDRGDVNVQPSQMPLSTMNIHTRSGDIDLHLPKNAMFSIAANAKRGDIENDFGEALAQQDNGQGARLQGAIGTGPDITLTTDRGTITVRSTAVGKSEGASNKGQTSNGRKGPAPAGNEVSL